MSLTLPPLNAIRAFEAAARSGSYVGAAKELGVSPAAISQQVRNLEDFLGKKMFMRFNNRVVLTDAGQAVFVGASEALQDLSALTEQIMLGRTRSRLVISVITSVAERWLQSRLAAFIRRHANLRIDLRVEPDPVDFARHNIDLRICYGANLYPEMTVVHLKHDEVLPLCGASYLERNPEARNSGMKAVPHSDLIHTDWGPMFFSHPTWKAWFAKAELPGPDDSKGYHIGTSGLVLDLARDGVGVALGQRMLAEDDLATGRLIALSELSLALGHPYSLVFLQSKSRKAGFARLVECLTTESGQLQLPG
jgi:LysR family glycine cleavage system transcriptional activator